MPVQPSVAPVARWGDAVYQFALLIADDRDAAQRLTIAAFRDARQADPAALADSALYGALLAAARSRRPALTLPRRKHLLPAAWAALPRFERALLGLWLLRDFDGQRLAELARLPADALVARLAAVLAPALDEPVDDQFVAWLSGALGLAAATPSYALDSAAHAARAARQQRLERLTTPLRASLANTHLPPGCAEAIEVLDDAEAPGAWRRSPVWVPALIGAALLLLVVVIAPWRGSSATPSGTAAGSDTPTTLVQHALDGWALAPGEATRHLRAWAAESRFAERDRLLASSRTFPTPQPHVTDIWLAPDGGFRFEVTRDRQTVEWMLSDGDDRLDYAVNTPASACEWIDVGVRGRTAQRFEIPPEQQQELLQTRLLLGAYGEGYRALQNALDATDLRSYGRRVEGDTQLIALGYTAPDGQDMLLLFDARTQQLRSVRAVTAQGAQATSRDLWRLEVDETIEGTLPRARPDWVNAPSVVQTAVLDPACPELRPDDVVSLRALAGQNLWWGEPYVPRTLPAGVERMLLLSSGPVEANITARADIRLLMVGPDRWLRITMGQGGIPAADARKVGEWDVTLVDDGLLRASLCRLIVVRPESRYCSPAFELTAIGWSEPELLAVIEQLTPVRPDNWNELDKLFVDATPLAPETAQLLVRAVDAALPAEGVLHTELASESRVNPRRQVWQDPYHVPLSVLEPKTISERRWLRYEGGSLREQRTEHVLADGTLLSAMAADGSTRATYSRVAAALQIEPDWLAFSALETVPHELALMLPLLESTEPITVSTVAEGTLLRQAADAALTNWQSTSWLVAAPFIDDLAGHIERRVWLDQANARAFKAELVMIDDTGGETLLNRATVVQHNAGSRMPVPSLADPATLPPDTLVYRREDPAQPVQVTNDGGVQLRPPERVLVLPDVESTALYGYREDANIEQALYSSLYATDQSGIADVRRYNLTGSERRSDRLLTVRQGPRDLMALVLRMTMVNSFREPSYLRGSQPVPVTLGGQPSTAWLIQEGNTPLLVAELDGIVLVFSGPDTQTLLGPVAESLGRMVWQTK